MMNDMSIVMHTSAANTCVCNGFAASGPCFSPRTQACLKCSQAVSEFHCTHKGYYEACSAHKVSNAYM